MKVVVQADPLGRKTEYPPTQFVGSDGASVTRSLHLKAVCTVGQHRAVGIRGADRKDAYVRLESTDVIDSHFFEDTEPHSMLRGG